MTVSGMLKEGANTPKVQEFSNNFFLALMRVFPNIKYSRLCSEQLGGVAMFMYCLESAKPRIINVGMGKHSVGAIGGVMANKGGIAFDMKVDDTTICVVGSHIAAGQSEVEKRHLDFKDIYEQTNEKHIIDDCQRIFSSWWINSDFNSDS